MQLTMTQWRVTRPKGALSLRASTRIAYSWANQSKCPIQIPRTL